MCLLYPIHQILISYILNKVIGALSVEKQLFQLEFSFKGVHNGQYICMRFQFLMEVSQCFPSGEE